MRRALIAVAVSSCLPTKRNPDYCAEDLPCEDGRVCDVAHNTCVDSIDAAANDGAMADGRLDAPPQVDANTSNPIVATYQAADLVLGQSTFATETDQGCAETAAYATSIAIDNDVLYVAEQTQYRALAWVPLPSTSNATANRVVGKGALGDCNAPAGVNGSTLSSTDTHLFAADGILMSAGRDQSRALIWNPAPTANGAAATLVLGQGSFSTSTPGNAATQMRAPRGVWTDGTRVGVADTNNQRVLLWTTFPAANGEAADLVLGQSMFGVGDSTPPATPTQSNMATPQSVWSDGTRVIVADTGQNRVLIWTSFPTNNGQNANIVIGQPNFTTKTAGLSATKMNQPTGIVVKDDALFVADNGNDRVLVFTPFPSANGEAATYVLGQPDLDTGANDPAPTQQSLDGPRQVAIDGNELWIADQQHRRALRFTLYQ